MMEQLCHQQYHSDKYVRNLIFAVQSICFYHLNCSANLIELGFAITTIM